MKDILDKIAKEAKLAKVAMYEESQEEWFKRIGEIQRLILDLVYQERNLFTDDEDDDTINMDAKKLPDDQVTFRTIGGEAVPINKATGEPVGGWKGNPKVKKEIAENKKEAKSASSSKSTPKNLNNNNGRKNKNQTLNNKKKTKNGNDYPQIFESEDFDNALDIAEQTAINDGFGKKYEQTVAKLKNDDVLHQISSEGEEIASIPCLASMVDDRCEIDGKYYGDDVQKEWEKARKNGEEITNDIVEISGKAGTLLSGLENAVKGASHTAGKIGRYRDKLVEKGKASPDISDAEVVARMGDLCRYTQMCEHDKMGEQIKQTVEEFRKKGYKVDVDNKWVKKGTKERDNDAEYLAVHIDGVAPNGQKFELQIHSTQSLAVKNVGHAIKDKRDKLAKEKGFNDPEVVKMTNEMRDLWRELPTPKGIEEVE